ncbi:hypothetical protein AAP_01167 [Ascosphaera apis ARSEF 7405]|uniref:Fringe-like glycosyltransferase domain-containing protein n=1 Tax=Ascosphaera apis ARSEF 7405 TaxID=392613 RepID=A0A168CBN2_9EURO|nr:hypothetical protein AAP_01167 [Ascosphaera apis ARSEF 7405]
MPIRFKTPFIAVAIILLFSFFWGLNKYDHAAVSRITGTAKGPTTYEQTTPSAASETPIETAVPGVIEQCDAPDVGAPVLNVKDWIVPKEFTRAFIQPHWVDTDAKFSNLEDVSTKVLNDFQPLGSTTNSSRFTSQQPCPNVIDIRVAKDLAVAGSENLLFGAATTVDRLDRMLPYLLYSFGHTKAHLLVLLPGDTHDIAKHEARYRARGLNVTLRGSPLAFTARYFGLVEAFIDFIKTTGNDIKWASFIDDDTFFPSLNHIVQKLNKLNHKDRWYIGTHSEASWQVNTFGGIGFGGGGVFISRAVLDALIFHYNECQSWGDQPGDQKVAQCIFKFTNTQLTKWDTLWQMDMTGTVDGFFESGRTIDSLHHWSSWYHKDVVNIYSVSPHSGRRGVLRRWKFDEDVKTDPSTNQARRSFWVMTNGYSIVKYSMDANLPAESVDFNKVEKTWNEDPKGYEARLGPFRARDQEGIKKERYLMTDTFMIGSNIHQMYTRDKDSERSMIEIVWLPPVQE